MPALIAAITMGPVAGILVELMKNILDWIFSGAPTGVPVGHMANFATGILFILPAYYIYKKFTSVKGLVVWINCWYDCHVNRNERIKLCGIFTDVLIFTRIGHI